MMYNNIKVIKKKIARMLATWKELKTVPPIIILGISWIVIKFSSKICPHPSRYEMHSISSLELLNEEFFWPPFPC